MHDSNRIYSQASRLLSRSMHYVTLFPDHPGMTDSAAILAAPLPWNDNAARAAYCVDAPGRPCVVELFRVPGRRSVNNISPAKGERHAPAKAELNERSG